MLELLPNPPIYGKYSHRLGEYPGYLDHSQPPMWNDGAPQRLFRKRISPRNAGVGRVGQMDYTWDDRVMSDGQFERNPQAKEAHDWIWSNIKDPNVFGFKSPRRWNHCGVRLIPPRPFYDREDGHFLLNNTCTLVHLHMKPELRRLQCYWLPKLPKLIHPVSYHPPVPRTRRASTIWIRPQYWVPPNTPWNIKSVFDDLEIEALQVIEMLKADKLNTQKYYKRFKGEIDHLRALHRLRKQPPSPPKEIIPCKLKVKQEELKNIREIKPQWEDTTLDFWIDELPNIEGIILAEEKAKKDEANAKATTYAKLREEQLLSIERKTLNPSLNCYTCSQDCNSPRLSKINIDIRK
ncbi:unnamed protein product [Sphagnum jensenii]|uniref:Uncharacterized protein n=1 Tax=Sphagnum jensenii TaxID=128206 RepID=A0ABP0X067_9BRYO